MKTIDRIQNCLTVVIIALLCACAHAATHMPPEHAKPSCIPTGAFQVLASAVNAR